MRRTTGTSTIPQNYDGVMVKFIDMTEKVFVSGQAGHGYGNEQSDWNHSKHGSGEDWIQFAGYILEIGSPQTGSSICVVQTFAHLSILCQAVKFLWPLMRKIGNFAWNPRDLKH